MTTRQTPDAVRDAARREIRNAWFDGRSAAKQYASEAVEAKWDRQVASILAALDSRADDAERIEAFVCDYVFHGEDGDFMPNAWTREILRDALTRFLERPATPAPAVDAQEDDEAPCTDCADTGITIQTERACSCEAGDQYRPPAVDAVPAGEGLDWAAIGHDYARSALKGEWPGVQSPHYALSGAFTAMAKEIEQLRAALSHGEGRK